MKKTILSFLAFLLVGTLSLQTAQAAGCNIRFLNGYTTYSSSGLEETFVDLGVDCDPDYIGNPYILNVRYWNSSYLYTQYIDVEDGWTGTYNYEYNDHNGNFYYSNFYISY
ncbi:MAG: hypothetical protein EOO90_06580 [Pedobacter sp.]|nr:MAG: hypothetical protein EOO90_06580 [Pedobacter sp.]